MSEKQNTSKSSRLASNTYPIKLAAIVATIGLVSSFTNAANYYWDGGTTNIAGNGDAASAGGAGTWNKTIMNWDSTSGSAHVIWTDGNTAVLGSTGGIVTLGVPISALNLQFSGTGYTVTPSGTNTLTLTAADNANGTSSAIYASGSGTNSIGGTINLTNSSYITAISGSTLNLTGAITQGTAATKSTTIYGPGAVNFSGAGAFATGKFNVQGGATFSSSANMSGFTQTYTGIGGDSTAIATWNITNGTVAGGSNALFVANGNNSVGVLSISGPSVVSFTGLFDVGNSFSNVGTNNGDGTGTATIAGSATLTVGSTKLGNTKSGKGTFNLDGGTLVTAGVSLGASTGGTGSAGFGVFNFNGGTLKPTAGNTTFLDSTLTTANVRNGGAIIDSNNFDITAAKALTHSNIGGDNATDGGLTKNGLGALTLGNTNTYNGATAVNNGSLLVNGSTLAASAVTVAAAANTTTATIGGTGTINGSVSLSAPTGSGRVNQITGGSAGAVGTLTVASLTFGAGTTYAADLSGSTGTNTVDRLTIIGAATSTTAKIAFNTIASTGSLTLGNYVLATAGSGTGLTAANFTPTSTPSGYRLVNNSATELDLQHQADQTMTNPTTFGIITGGSATISNFAKLNNAAPSGSTALAVALADNGSSGGTFSGLTASTGSTVAAASSANVSGTFTAGGTAGAFTYNVKNTDANAITNPASTTGTVNVFNHSNGALTVASGDNQTFITGYSAGSAGINLTNTGANNVALDVNSVTGLTAATPTGTALVAANGTKSYTAALNTATTGLNQTQNVSANVRDTALPGQGAAYNATAAVNYNVLDHASAAVDTDTTTPGVQAGNSVTLNLGSFSQAAGTQNVNFADELQNLAGTRSTLDFDSFAANSGSDTQLQILNSSLFTALAAGSTAALNTSLDLNTVGTFNATYLLHFSDADGYASVGGTSFASGDTLTVNLTGTVTAIPEPASLALFGLGALGVLRRRHIA